MKFMYPILLMAVLSLPAYADTIELPELGDSSATVLSPLQEQRIAEQIMRDVYNSNQVLRDAEVTDYITSLGLRLAANSPDRRQEFRFFAVRDNSINAFAMPGGVIGVHTGLIVAANNESEVAGVLGHEIGHVVQRHLARMLAQQKTDSIISMAGMALALLAARGSPQLSSGAMAAASAGAIQRQLDYTREHEREADRVGFQILQNAGFDTRGLATFFETLQKGSRFSDGSAPSFLRTHPLTTERIADVRGRAEASSSFRMLPYSPDFEYVKAKLVAAIGSPQQAISVFQHNLQERRYTSEEAQHYGLAIAFMRKNDQEGAAKELAWLRQNAMPHAMIETLAANIEVARKQPEKAAKQFAAALERFPNHRALIYGYAEHFLATNQPDKLLKLVDEKVSAFPDDAYLYELKSRAYTAQGKNLLRHQAQGESYVRQYNLQGALEQFDLAAKAGDGDFYQQSIVEARLNELRQRVDKPKKDGWFN
jgi:predicted Zn-dependent protease